MRVAKQNSKSIRSVHDHGAVTYCDPDTPIAATNECPAALIAVAFEISVWRASLSGKVRLRSMQMHRDPRATKCEASTYVPKLAH
jgi:hypothetical protein